MIYVNSDCSSWFFGILQLLDTCHFSPATRPPSGVSSLVFEQHLCQRFPPEETVVCLCFVSGGCLSLSRAEQEDSRKEACCIAEQPQPKRRRRIDRSMIGEPTNFVHTTHVGSGDMNMGLASVDLVQAQMKSKGGYAHGGSEGSQL
ncbi:hypothetical protein OJAV_G00024680 [Oryzias javanicus]|uniref:CRIB domain-containing protein n=1 Tax=Oryzias javanicus TaxID=123683 RepID=A0A437DI68_ORYJA|nr:hypothetical protein OJAV_G00024680 [Oryzias javanicus]